MGKQMLSVHLSVTPISLLSSGDCALVHYVCAHLCVLKRDGAAV